MITCIINNSVWILNSAGDADNAYLENALPQKMKWNLIKNSALAEIRTMIETVIAVIRRDYQ